jgi:purine-nucleoside phosphorylase
MVGRLHTYEGLASFQTTYPIRIFSLLKCRILITTNAAGSLNHKQFGVGSIMVIKDHINLPGLVGHSPLMGRNLDMFGPRFPPTSDAYDVDLRKIAIDSYKEVGDSQHSIGQGVYVHVAGPQYETPAEARFLRLVGADAVGMSTIPEVLVARHCGMKVLGISLITNNVVMPEEEEKMEIEHKIETASHEEVLRTSKDRAKVVQALVERIVQKISL